MANPTVQEITNLYLYGTKTTPENLVDENLIRGEGISFKEAEVDRQTYMTTGAGRFALGGLFDIVQMFFTLPTGLPPGSYTKLEIATAYGIEDFFGLRQFQTDLADDVDDYAERFCQSKLKPVKEAFNHKLFMP